MHRHLDGHKDLTLTAEVNRSIDPDVIYIPLVNGNAPCAPCVKVGDDVKVGTKVAERNDHFYLPLFSSVSGSRSIADNEISCSAEADAPKESVPSSPEWRIVSTPPLAK